MIGVLAMAYGTPRDRDDIETYYTDIRRGRPPTPELLADLVRRYDALGGTFPLRAATRAQCEQLQHALDECCPGEFTVALGQKHASPKVEDGVATLAGRGVEQIVGLVLAPHYSRFSVGEYAERAERAAAEHGLPAETIESWATLPAYVAFLAAAVRDALGRVPEGAKVVFTAHSLPRRILAAGDPYPDQVRATATAVATACGLRLWDVGWQSAGRTPEPWLGPDVLEIVRAEAAAGTPGLVICACGFVADHLEVAYDLDIEAAALAAELGLPFARTASLAADPAAFAELAQLVHTTSEGG